MRGEESGDWYGRWERHKRRQYEALRRHVEENPYDALFGASNRWLGWLNYSTISSSSRAQGVRQQHGSAFTNRQETKADRKSSAMNDSRSNQTESSHFSEPIQEYEIDPITLRKVPIKIKKDTSHASSTTKAKDATGIPVMKFQPAETDHSVRRGSWKQSPLVDEVVTSPPKGWLSKEGFGRQAAISATAEAPSTSHSLQDSGKPSIESALDRHIKTRPVEEQSPSETPTSTPKWTSQDANKTLEVPDAKSSLDQASRTDEQAIDLAKTTVPQWRNPMQSTSTLTSSQVARLRSKLVPLKTQIDTLKDNYATLQHQILQEKRRIQIRDERRAARQAGLKLENALQQEVEKQKDAMKAMETRGRDDTIAKTTKIVPDDELRGEGDIASNVHEFLDRARWYKRKAPHAKCEMDAKMQRLAKEKAFVKEIRGIYEDTYGTIDSSHRQPARHPDVSGTYAEKNLGGFRNDSTASTVKSNTHGIGALELFVATELGNVPATPQIREIAASIDESIRELRQNDRQRLSENISSLKSKIKTLLEEVNGLSTIPPASATNAYSALASSPSSVYRILAYDHSTQRVTSAKTESSTPLTNDGQEGKEPSLPMHQVLTKLYNPGKFLPHLHALQNRGFDVVSVTGDVVMLKKVREPIVSRDDFPSRPNPIDGTTTPEVSAGNFASPTGYVNYGPVIPPEEQQRSQPAAPRSEDKVKRQEDVFSGDSGQWHESKVTSKRMRRRARKWQTLKKMLLTGTVTGAVCYAVGMIEENRLLL